MSRKSAKPVVTRVYKVSRAEKDLLRSLKGKEETWFDYLSRIGEIAAALPIAVKSPRDLNLRLDLPSEIYEVLRQRGESSGHSVLALLLAAAELMNAALPNKAGRKSSAGP